MRKIAFLALCAVAPKILRQLCKHFPADRYAIYAHVDAKVNIENYKHDVGDWPHLHLLNERREVYWAGFSMVEATLDLARRALADPSVEACALISDDSFPLLSPEQLFSTIIHTEESWIQSWRIPGDHLFQKRYLNYYYLDSRLTSPRWFLTEQRAFSECDYINILELQILKAKGKKPLDALFCGKQWWTMKRAELEQLVAVDKDDSHLRNSFRFSAVSDEMYLQTIYRICFPNRPQRGNPMLDDFTRQPQPFVFHSHEEVRQLLAASKANNPSTSDVPQWLFARKIHPAAEQVAEDLASGWI